MKWLKLNKNFIFFFVLLSLVFLPILSAQAAVNVEILDVKAEVIDGKTVEIIWNTNVATEGKVLYGESSNYLPSFVGIGGSATTYHSVKIGNFKPETTYYYQIAIDDYGQTVYSFVNQFKTASYNDTIPPQLSNVSVPFYSGTTAVFTWDTDKPSTSKVEYDTAKTYSKKKNDNKKVTKHFVVLKNLTPNMQYFTRVYSIDKDNNVSGFTFKDFTTQSNALDNASLTLSNLRPSGASDSQIAPKSVTVSFTINRYAKGKISLKGKKFRTQTKSLDYGLNHSANFFDLTPSTNYDVEISMTDILGKKVTKKFTIPTKQDINIASGNIYYGQSGVSGVQVLGAEYSYYTSASALYKLANSPKVYSIVNNQRHHITSLASFKEYGYSWKEIKIVSESNLLKYPTAKLVKSPEGSTVYYLYERPGEKTLKLGIPSPSVFNSYPGNNWGKIVKITQNDIDSYSNAKLIKASNSVRVYYLENNTKRYVSDAAFINHNFKKDEIVEVSEKHLESYKDGAAL